MQIHGGISGEELRSSNREILDFSVSVNPFAPQPVLTHIRDLERYPSRISERFSSMLADHYSVSSEMILPLGGATEGIYLLPNIFRDPAGLFPLYGDYIDSFKRHAIDVTSYELLPECCNHDLFLIVNPQNPTGFYIEKEEIVRFAQRNPETTVVVDEAYQEMGEFCESVIAPDLPRNLLILRSLTKASGWPSFRSGCFVGNKDTISVLRKWVLPWQITSTHLHLLELYLNHYSHYRETWKHHRIERDFLYEQLCSRGVEILDGRAPFLTFRAGGKVSLQNELFEKYNILIRDCTSFEMEGWYRIMPQDRVSNCRLLESLDSLI